MANSRYAWSGLAVALFATTIGSPVMAQNSTADTFSDGKDGAKIHAASGFVCPQKIGAFERDAIGESDIDTGADFCAYYALDGVYGTITLTPLTGAYDAKTSLADSFSEVENTGGKLIGQNWSKFGALPLYTRIYQTTTLEDLRYRMLFAGAAVEKFAVEVTLEYADPRDTPLERDFLHAAFESAAAVEKQ